ncbi:hypothetical protein GJAV_G00130780 [Gymnothorax javanicus]|nr:hypothetical protein GJAV_G00130780 [Gymnothorax javanicus]
MEEDTVVHIDLDFKPQIRPRSCTWPLHRADISIVDCEGTNGEKSAITAEPLEDEQEQSRFPTEPEKARASGGVTKGKASARRNPWGTQSYADLISEAIESSPEKRLTLAQIYDWIVASVPYFKDKGDRNSSVGWKNSIRHNLSLHNKFLRVNNESTNKSSWWILNPDAAKGTKVPRRRAASMDNSSKLLKSRMRAKQIKKQAAVVVPEKAGGARTAEGAVERSGPTQQLSSWEMQSSSILSPSGLEDPCAWTSFRPRADSSASTLSGRLSPSTLGLGDEDQLPENGLNQGCSGNAVTSALAEELMVELDLTDGLALMAGQGLRINPRTVTEVPSKPLHSSPSAVPPQVANFTSFASLQTLKLPDPPLYKPSTVQAAGSNSSFGSALVNPMMSSGSQEGNFRTRVPSALELLLTSDSPPPCDVMMTHSDLPMPRHEGAELPGLEDLFAGGKSQAGQLTPGGNISLNSVTTTTPQRVPESQLGTSVPGLSQDGAQLTEVKSQFTAGLSRQSVELPFGDGVSQSSPGSEMGAFGNPSSCTSSQDLLSEDMDLDKFIENLEWDVEAILNRIIISWLDAQLKWDYQCWVTRLTTAFVKNI